MRGSRYFGAGYNNFAPKCIGLIIHPAVGALLFVIVLVWRSSTRNAWTELPCCGHPPAPHVPAAGRPGGRDPGGAPEIGFRPASVTSGCWHAVRRMLVLTAPGY